MTIHKLTAGDGYTYLTRQVAGGDVERERGQDAAEYYTAKGNPPGRWKGRGAPVLGLEGEQVTEEQMKALFGMGLHPDADAIINDYLTDHLRPGMSDRQVEAVQAKALRAASLGAAFPEYKPIERFDKRVRQRLEVIEQETGRAPTAVEIKRVRAEEARRSRAAVAGFDVVFAPVKSAALLWALDPRLRVRRAVRQAHEAARDSTLEMIEEHAAFTRVGKGGIAQIQTRGLIMAVFDHYDSRAGDPNLHTHVAISSKVQGIDGKWRSLDARALYRITVAASEHYNTAFETELRQRIPATFTERPDTASNREPVREIAGVPVEFIAHYSSRRTDIEARYDQLLRQFRREHGHDPSRQICHQLARQANLDTREGKKTARSLAEMRADWAQALAETFGPQALGRLMAAVPDHLPDLAEPATEAVVGAAVEVDVAGFAGRVVANVAEMRSTWTVWNLRAEAERLARAELVFASPEQHRSTVARIVEAAVSPRWSIRVNPPELLTEPELLRRSDDASVFAEHAAARYTSRLILDAEDRLVTAANTHTAVALAGTLVAASLEGFDARGTALDAGQRTLVTRFATDNRLLVAGLGPAGAGKTTAMRAYAHLAAQAGQRILPLATSAAAADILGRELGVRADNLHKFVHEYTVGRYAEQLRTGQPVPRSAAMFALHPGDVVLLDEAGMAGTLTLDRLVRIVAQRGAVVRLLGDYRQLGAVESGGALRLIATQSGAVELTTLYRFRDPAEAEATLKLRVGDASGLDFYAAENRIRSGSKQAMIESAYAGWKADMLAGKTTLMAAASGVNVTALAAQARTERIEAGQVEPYGVRLHDGNLASVGDWITTRHNDRKLQVRGGRDWVKNGDAWTILQRHSDGSLTVRHLEHHGTLRLPAAYVQANVELLYATTTNRAQGSTVDTAHPLITAEMSRENLYVTCSRARERTVLHVVTHELLAYDPDERTDRVKNDARQYAAREVLENILAREGNELSATESIRHAAEMARSLSVWVPRHQHAAMLLASEHYAQLAAETLALPLTRALTECDGWPAVVTALTRAEVTGWPARQLLASIARHGDLLNAETPARLMAWRINAHIADRTPPGPLAQPSVADAARYAALLRPYTGERVLDAVEATCTPAVLIGDSAGRRGAARVSSHALAGYAKATATALGVPIGDVIAHRAWPHLAAALAAADRAGRHIPGLLATIAAGLTRPDRERPSEALVPLVRTLRRLLDADPATGPIAIPGQLRHATTVAAALGIDAADRVRSERAWPALDAALHRAEHGGHDPREMLARVADARNYTCADSPAQVLAWRLNRYLRTRPAPTTASATSGQGDQEWRLVAWTLKALEDHGTDLTKTLILHDGGTLGDVLHHARQAASASHRHSGPLPWLASTEHTGDPDHTLTGYLNDTSALISERIQQLADTAIIARPAWIKPLGSTPEDPAERAEWIWHIGVVAAYRDQQQISTDDPRQILGPYAEPGTSEHAAYWHTVDSILAARRLAGLDHDTGRQLLDPARAQVAADLYLALPDDERAAVHAALAERHGQVWFGDRIAVDDDAAMQPVHAPALTEVLVERGHLAPAQPEVVPEVRSHDGDRAQEPMVRQRPLESELAQRRKAQQDAERAARLERAQRARMRDQARRAKQQRRAQPRRQQTQDAQAAPLLEPPNQQQTQRQERQFGR